MNSARRLIIWFTFLSAGFISIFGGSVIGGGVSIFIIFDGSTSDRLTTIDFFIGVSGSLGIILSLALKYDGSSLTVGGSTTLGILVLF